MVRVQDESGEERKVRPLSVKPLMKHFQPYGVGKGQAGREKESIYPNGRRQKQ